MSTDNEESSTTHTSTTNIGCNINYCVLKLIEMFVVITGFGLSTTSSNYGMQFVQFVTMSAFVLTSLQLVFHIIGIIHKLPGPWPLIELIFCALYSLMLLIAGIVATARAIYPVSFCVFSSCVLYLMDTFLCLRAYQGARSSSSSGASTTATTTTTQQSNETRAQY